MAPMAPNRKGIDLRKALAHLQVLYQVRKGAGEDGLGVWEEEGRVLWKHELVPSEESVRGEEDGVEKDGLEKAWRAMDAQSFSDSFVDRRLNVSIVVSRSLRLLFCFASR